MVQMQCSGACRVIPRQKFHTLLCCPLAPPQMARHAGKLALGLALLGALALAASAQVRASRGVSEA